MKFPYFIVFLLTLVFGIGLAMVVVTPDALGRAGGGQNYSSGSSSGSSFDSSSSFDSDFGSSSGFSSSGGSGGGSICGTGVFITIVIVIILFAVLKSKARRAARNAGGQQFNNAMNQMMGSLRGAAGAAAVTGMMTPQQVQQELSKLKQKDPGFNEQSFKDYVQNAFYKIQEAWEKQDLNIGRPYMADQLMQRYSTQIDDLKSRGERNILENIVIGHQTITSVRSDEQFDYITVKVDASMTDYTVDKNNKMVSGDKQIKPFTEYWTFLRKGNVKSDSKKGAQANTCPNCGAPLQLNATGKCEYCNAIVTSGDYDWVLSEIQQSH